MASVELVTPQIIAVLAQVQERMRLEEDETIAKQIDDLIVDGKDSDGALCVAFCGLFSAGKSSLLNRLCNVDTLAVGAVPTTTLAAQLTLPGCDGQVVLMDTPGVDSTDEAHQREARAALVRADWTALVMDYQHVESSANLDLARELSESGTRLILVVNQIDKHVDFELSFDEFRSRVERVWDDYEIHYNRVFYTSTQESAENEIDALASFLRGLAPSAQTARQERLRNRLRQLIAEHVDKVLSNREEALADNLKNEDIVVPFDRQEAASTLDALSAQADASQLDYTARLEQLRAEEEQLRNGLYRDIELAQVAPYETTERGRTFAESLRKDFHVGWFSSKQKISMRRESLLQSFHDDLKDRVEKFLVWPLQNKLREVIAQTQWAQGAWLAEVDSIYFEVTPRLCQDRVKLDALASSQYPYQYVAQLVDFIKGQVKALLSQHLDAWFEAADAQYALDNLELTNRLGALRRQSDLLHNWVALQEEREDRCRAFFDNNDDHRSRVWAGVEKDNGDRRTFA